MTTIVMLKKVRLAFPQLWTPQAFTEGQTPKYQGTFLIDPTTQDSLVKAMHAAAKQAGTAKWGGKFNDPNFRKSLKIRYLVDGDEKSQYAGFAGMLYATANNAKRQPVIDRDKTPLSESDGRPYGGCYVNAQVEVWAQDNKYGKAINNSLLTVQFVADGESFGGGRVGNTDDFEDLEDDEPASGGPAYDEVAEEEYDPLA